MASKIYLIDVEGRKIRKELVFHQRGVQSLAFGYNDRLLFSVGVKEVNVLCIHSVENYNVVASRNIPSTATNKILVQNIDADNNKDERVFWATLGNQGSLILWSIMFEGNIDNQIKQGLDGDAIKYRPIDCPTEELSMTNFISGAFRIDKVKGDKIIIGCHDGTVCAFDLGGNYQYFDDGRKAQLKQRGAITQVVVATSGNQVVLGNENGQIFNYSISTVGKREVDVLPPEDEDRIQVTDLKDGNYSSGAITAMFMTEDTNEGMIGTSKGMIFYACLKDSGAKSKEGNS